MLEASIVEKVSVETNVPSTSKELNPVVTSFVLYCYPYFLPQEGKYQHNSQVMENKEEIDDLRKKIRILEEENNELRRKFLQKGK
nr:unnamed protein product [Callosobruchus analis]